MELCSDHFPGFNDQATPSKNPMVCVSYPMLRMTHPSRTSLFSLCSVSMHVCMAKKAGL